MTSVGLGDLGGLVVGGGCGGRVRCFGRVGWWDDGERAWWNGGKVVVGWRCGRVERDNGAS